MKKLFAGIFLALILITATSPAYAAEIEIKIDGVTIASDVNPELINNRIMVPLRVISENLGVNVNWSNSEALLSNHEMQVVLTLNSNIAVKNGTAEILDVKPYVKNNRLYVPMRFLAETFGSNVDYDDGAVTVAAKPFLIAAVKVGALQREYHMTLGGAVEQMTGNGYNEAIYHLIVNNIGSKVEPPTDYTWSLPNPGGYYKNGQYDFLDEKGNSIVRFDIYTLVQASDETEPGQPFALLHAPAENQWYIFSDSASQAIYQLIDKASANGFVTVISNTVP